MPLKKQLTQPRSKCFKATTRITQVFPSLCRSFVLKRKRSRSGLSLPSFTETLAWGAGGLSRNSSGPHFCSSLLASLRQHPARCCPNPCVPPTPALGCLPGPSAAARRPHPRRHRACAGAPECPCVPRKRSGEEKSAAPSAGPRRRSNRLQMIFQPKTRHSPRL